MSERLTMDTYKTIYQEITPSDEFKERLLSMETEHKIYKMKPRMSYIAAMIICMLVMVSGTVYAYTHPMLIQRFFGEKASQDVVETIYSEMNQTIYCEGYLYTLEGHYFDEVDGRGYLNIRVEAEDGVIPTIVSYSFEEQYEWEKAILGEFGGPAYLGYILCKVGDSEICILHQEAIDGFGWMEANDEYITLNYSPMYEADTFGISIIPLEAFKEKYREVAENGQKEKKKRIESKIAQGMDETTAWSEAHEEVEREMISAFHDAFESITLPRKSIEIVEYDYDNIHVEVGYSMIKATWNNKETDVQTIATIVNGERKVWVNRGDAISGSHIEYLENQGYEEGDMAFECWKLGLCDPTTVQIEINGVILE